MVSVDDVRQFVMANPGLHIRDIVDGLGLTNGTSDTTNTRRKLNSLIKFKIIEGLLEPSDRVTGRPKILHYYPWSEKNV